MHKHCLIITLITLLFQSISLAQDTNTPNPLSDDQIDLRIQQYRTAPVILQLTDKDGNPIKHTPVTIQQINHKFLFGCNGFKIDPKNDTEYNKQFADLFNFATLGFYWGSYEYNQGKTRFDHLAAQARWCKDHNITPKGHPLAWHQVVPKWLNEKPVDEVEQLQFDRIDRDVTAFKDLIETWDVINEVVVMPTHQPKTNPITKLCNKLTPVGLIEKVFERAKKSNPTATLILNDFNTSEAYAKLIQGCLDKTIPIDIIGIQSHQHKGYMGKQKLWEICERFKRFNLPLHFTEMTLLSGILMKDNNFNARRNDWNTTPEGEARQEQEVREAYRLLFSHPSVQAITWWDFNDGEWLGAPAGLIRKDFTPKPAYNSLHKLIKEDWMTGPIELITDDKGQVTFRGYLGDYKLSANCQLFYVTLDKPEPTQLNLKLPHPAGQ